jgi:ABC-type glutathione transport system ATPase component
VSTTERCEGLFRAVDRVSFDIGAAEVLGLVGESGCGKSTLGRGVLGLLPEGAASDGQVLYGGRNLVGLSPKELSRLRGPELGLIFQEPMTRLNPLLRIEDHFKETLEQHEPQLTTARSASARWRRSAVWASRPRASASTRTSSRAGCGSES